MSILRINDGSSRQRRVTGMHRFALLAALMPGVVTSAQAGTQELKLSAGNYFYQDPAGNFSGQDLNLRYRRDTASAWIGYYRDRDFGSEGRIGADGAWQSLAALPVTLLPSVQSATHGFLGGSLSLQIGSAWYAQAGIARTNLRPYVDLGFDPGDALSFGIGRRFDAGCSLSLITVADDRLHTHQRNTHLTAQWPLSDDQRVVVDLLRKTGDGDTGHIANWGASLTYDFSRWFLRAAYDPKQNYGTADVTRISGGVRF